MERDECIVSKKPYYDILIQGNEIFGFHDSSEEVRGFELGSGLQRR